MAIKNLLDIQLHLFICNGGSCCKNGAEETTNIIRSTIKKMGAFANVHTTKTLCNGRCDDAPVVIVMPQGNWYKSILPQYAEEFTVKLLNNDTVPQQFELYAYGNEVANSASIPRDNQ